MKAYKNSSNSSSSTSNGLLLPTKQYCSVDKTENGGRITLWLWIQKQHIQDNAKTSSFFIEITEKYVHYYYSHVLFKRPIFPGIFSAGLQGPTKVNFRTQPMAKAVFVGRGELGV